MGSDTAQLQISQETGERVAFNGSADLPDCLAAPSVRRIRLIAFQDA
ncbi:hypothetical protein RSK20926_16987 [Roseobacter sp. SK209-2-6]|nr:hypothetical protein RSK20926_16987 [Roseobacter sp. SK209-2-6]